MKLNHIGMVVKDIEKQAQFYRELGFDVSDLIINETQKVKEIFVQQNELTTIELLEPLNESSPVFNFLQKGGGMHHLCYELDKKDGDIHEFIQKQRQSAAVILCHPVDDIAFQRKIAFFYKFGKIIEVLEALS